MLFTEDGTDNEDRANFKETGQGLYIWSSTIWPPGMGK